MYLRNSDHNKYGTLKKNLQSQYALGNNQYPGNMTKITHVLTNNSWGDKYKYKIERSGNKIKRGTRTMIRTRSKKKNRLERLWSCRK